MKSQSQRGAAILTAMLTVVLVATLAASALWQQWRAVEVEAAELLVDLSFTPVLRTGVVRVTCHNELVSQVLSSGELD